MKQTFDLLYRGNQYQRKANSLEEAKEIFARESLIDIREVKGDFWRDVFPVGLLVFGIGLISLGFLVWMAYLIS